jgi:hypothetical protein
MEPMLIGAGWVTFEILEHTALPYAALKAYQRQQKHKLSRQVKRALR